MSERTALVAGASGLVGGHLLDLLLSSPDVARVISLGRRPLERADAKLDQRSVDFAHLDALDLPPVTEAYCCLGTTLAKAGSREAFRAVDHDAVLAFARLAKRAGAERFLIVTALGADPRSGIFYNRVKGEVEEALKGVGFSSLTILQPSLLLGDRAESRPGERAAILASRVFAPLLRPFASRPIEARTVARAMVALGRAPRPGTRVVASGELQTLGA